MIGRQVSKRDLERLARALGLAVGGGHTTASLFVQIEMAVAALLAREERGRCIQHRSLAEQLGQARQVGKLFRGLSGKTNV